MCTQKVPNAKIYATKKTASNVSMEVLALDANKNANIYLPADFKSRYVLFGISLVVFWLFCGVKCSFSGASQSGQEVQPLNPGNVTYIRVVLHPGRFLIQT